MPDDAVSGVVPSDEATAALAYLTEMSPDLRGAAILAPDGAVLAASGEDGERWSADAIALLAIADRAGEEPAEQVHIGTEQGEVFVLRHAGLVAVAVTERLALASLTFFDLRSLLREIGAGEG